jgi:tryptophan halogenase
MSAGAPIRDIVVAGSGIVGWSAAALLKRRLPGANVMLVGAVPPPEAIGEWAPSSLPSITGFHGDLGLAEADVLAATGASFRLGALFEGWSAGLPPYVHAYGEYGRALGTTPFHLHWARLARAGEAPAFDSHSPGAMLGRAGRFVHPQGDPGSPLSTYEYGLNFDPGLYHGLLRAYGRHLGVVERGGAVADVRIAGETGLVEALQLGDGSAIAGHLFVDCTGPEALVRSRLDDRFEDWSQWLPCDRVLFVAGPGTPDPQPLDRAVAHPAGWGWQSASRAMTSYGIVYSSAHMGDDAAARALGVETGGTLASVRSGRRSQPWLRNCVAIGDAAVSLDPLEWTNLHLAHSALDRLIAKMPDRDFSPVELWDYNRECAAEADRARDFAALHYAVANRPEPFWRDAAAAGPPESLAHTLRLFRERGKLPYYEEETFTRDSWAAVLFGQGVLPRRIDPLTGTVPAEQASRTMAQMRESITAMVPTLPTLGDYLRRAPAAAPQ